MGILESAWLPGDPEGAEARGSVCPLGMSEEEWGEHLKYHFNIDMSQSVVRGFLGVCETL